MKRAVFVVLQIGLFLIVFFAGSILPGLRPDFPQWSVTLASGKHFILLGLFLMIAVFVLILLVEVLRRRRGGSWKTSTLAFVLALLFLLATKFPLALITPSANF